MPEKVNVDDAIRFLIDFAQNPRMDGYSSYGYEIYLPNVIHFYRNEVLNIREPRYLGQGQEAERLSPVFYDAAWELCRRGIYRPGIRRLGEQATDDGASGNGYSLTSAGRRWLTEVEQNLFIPTQPDRFAQIISRFRERLGDGYTNGTKL